MRNTIILCSLLFSFGAANAQLSKVIGKVLSKKSADFSNMVVTYGYTTNMYSPEEKTLTSKIAKDEWKEGSSMVGVVFMKKDGVGLIELDGKVTIDGVEVEYFGLGSYFAFYENDDFKPKTIRIENANGDFYEQLVTPAEPVKIKSVNGQTSGTATIDLQEDLQVALDINDKNRNHMISLGMIVGVPGGKDFSLFAVARAKDQLTIPYQAVSTKQVSGGGITGKTNVIDFKDDNLLRVESFDEVILENTPFGDARILAASWDFFDAKVTGKDKGVNYLITKGKTDKEHGQMEYLIRKPSNFYAPALSNIQNVGIASLNVSGVLFAKESSESSHTVGNMRYTTVTTTTWQFPQLDDAYWNQLLEDIYQSTKSNFSTNYGMTFTEIEKITSHPEYRGFFEAEDKNTEKLVQKSYKGSKRLQPGTVSEILSSTSMTFTRGLPEYKLQADLGLDAMIMITVDLRVSKANKKKVVLDPVVTFKIVGSDVSYGQNPLPLIAEGTVSGTGVPFKMKDLNSLNALTEITQWENLLYGINAALSDLQALEAEEKYFETWQLLD